MIRPNKWFILILAGLTNAISVAAPGMGLSVLFKEISLDLNLTLVQVGFIWGISSLPGILTSLWGGAITDKYGPRRIIIIGIILVGITGALRGLSNSFFSMVVAVVLSGLLIPLVSMSNMKSCSLWFPRNQLGLANGVLSMGMALGFLIGSMLSATVLSPWLGGWRQVFYFYSALTILLCIPWLFTPPPPVIQQLDPSAQSVSMRQAIGQIIRLKNIWFLSIGILGIGGCIQATLGYLPLYLRNLGWTSVMADSALSSFHLTSMIFTLPFALLSDRLGSRRNIVLGMSMMVITGIGLLSVMRGPAIWFFIIMAGLVRDGFMAIFITMIVETDGIGSRFSGTAIGFVMIFSMVGSLIAPPLGNLLAETQPGLPFLFWAFLAVIGMTCLAMTSRPQPARVVLSGDLAESN